MYSASNRYDMHRCTIYLELLVMDRVSVADLFYYDLRYGNTVLFCTVLYSTYHSTCCYMLAALTYTTHDGTVNGVRHTGTPAHRITELNAALSINNTCCR